MRPIDWDLLDTLSPLAHSDKARRVREAKASLPRRRRAVFADGNDFAHIILPDDVQQVHTAAGDLFVRAGRVITLDEIENPDLENGSRSAELVMEGDAPGHDFHGNQWTGGIGSSINDTLTAKYGTDVSYEAMHSISAEALGKSFPNTFTSDLGTVEGIADPKTWKDLSLGDLVVLKISDPKAKVSGKFWTAKRGGVGRRSFSISRLNLPSSIKQLWDEAHPAPEQESIKYEVPGLPEDEPDPKDDDDDKPKVQHRDTVYPRLRNIMELEYPFLDDREAMGQDAPTTVAGLALGYTPVVTGAQVPPNKPLPLEIEDEKKIFKRPKKKDELREGGAGSGDTAGHEFHGNQWTGGIGGSSDHPSPHGKVISTRKIGEGNANPTKIVTLNNGSTWLQKINSESGSAEGEVLAYRVGELLGAPVPYTEEISPGVTRQEFVGGATSGLELMYGEEDVDLNALYTSLEGQRIAAMDFVIGNEDRHNENWLVKDGHLIAIDNGNLSMGKIETFEGFGSNVMSQNGFGEAWAHVGLSGGILNALSKIADDESFPQGFRDRARYVLDHGGTLPTDAEIDRANL